jgi:hypothetical protein
MKAVVKQSGGVVEISFVPKVAKSTPAAPAAPATAPTAAPSVGRTTDDVAASRLDKKLNSVDLDRPVSAVPAFVALDLSPETVANPQSPRDFAAALLNGVDRNGVLQTGIALETAPFRMMPWLRTDISAYRSEYWTRFLYNFSFSLATAKASEESDAVQLSLGFHAILYQDATNDPRRNPALMAAFNAANLAHPMSARAFDDPLPDENPIVRKTLQAAVAEFQQQHWAGTIWSAAAAPTWYSESGKASELNGEGFTAWTTFAYGTHRPIFGEEGRFQFLAHLRYRAGELIADRADDTRTVKQDSFLAAARLRVGSPTFNGFVEGGYLRIWDGVAGDGSAYRIAAGLEKRIASGIWLVLSLGEQLGDTANDDELFAIGSIRFGTADDPRLGIE